MVERAVGDKIYGISQDACVTCECLDNIERSIIRLTKVMEKISETLGDMYEFGVK